MSIITKKLLDSSVVSPPAPETHGAPVSYRDSWRIFKIMSEFVEGYQLLGKFKREITVLGSARFTPNNPYYKIAEKLGKLLAKAGFTVITGGGPGIMEAANKGAVDGHGQSVGLNIQLPTEQRLNNYVKESVGFYYFFTRKVMLTAPGNAYIFFPGGFGTMDEFFEVVDYMELGQMDKAPVVLVGREYWEPLRAFLREHSAHEAHAVREMNFSNWHIVETAEEAFNLVKDVKERPMACATDPNNPLCIQENDWKVFRIMAELVEGFEFLTKVSHDVTVLGTRSIPPTSPYYVAAYAVGELLANKGFATITGGGPGIMEAANKGAFEHGGTSIGINMRFESGEQRVNNYLTKSIGFLFPYVRKLIITAPSSAFIFFPGGFGTLHQLFELLTMQETKKMEPFPLILYGRKFWEPLLAFIHSVLHLKFKTISDLDEDLIKIVDSPEEVARFL